LSEPLGTDSVLHKPTRKQNIITTGIKHMKNQDAELRVGKAGMTLLQIFLAHAILY
jgi:hypothetical protein